MSEDELLKLPVGWYKCQFIDIVESFKRGPFGSAIKKEYFVPQGYKVYQQQNAIYDNSSLGHYYIDKDKFEELSAFAVQSGDFIVSCSGTIGRISYLKDVIQPGVINQALLRIRLNKEILSDKFFLFIFRSEAFQRKILIETKGSAMLNIAGVKELKTIPIDLPPTKEQHRIVAKIEELFSEIDKGVESLKTAKAQLQVYRQALLKHAFEGKLTAQWRSDNPDKVVPAAELLRSIEQSREERYQQQLTDWQTAVEKWEFNGKEGKKPSKPKKILDVEQFSDDEKSLLPNLPDNWLWMRLAQIVEKIQIGPFGSLLHKEDYVVDGIPLVNPVHIQSQKIIPHSNSTVSQEKIKELGIYRLKENDIVLGRRGEMGRCAVVSHLENGWLCGSGSLYIRLLFTEASQFYCQVLSSRRVKDYLTDSSIGTTMDNLNQNILNNVPIPLCSTTELKVIEEELDRQFLYVDRSLTDIDLNLQKAEMLRQSILKKAFSGQLVPQDPTDETASELLKRIQAEKAQRETTTKTKRKSTNLPRQLTVLRDT
jgi:type I restriction enzyme, S subunit